MESTGFSFRSSRGLRMAKTIESYKVTSLGNVGDAGESFDVYCPECEDKIACSDFGWWPTVCQCGYHWTVELKATGVKTSE